MKNSLLVILAFLSSYSFASDWEATAQRHLAAPGGKQYELVAAKFSASILGQAMSNCVRSAPSAFKLYLKLTAGGAVSESSANPSSALANCFIAELSKATWPKPPFSPFVYSMEMFGSPTEFGR